MCSCTYVHYVYFKDIFSKVCDRVSKTGLIYTSNIMTLQAHNIGIHILHV